MAAVPTTTQTGLAETTRRFAEEALPLATSLRELRRDLHRHPELGNRLPRTQATVLVAAHGCEAEVRYGVVYPPTASDPAEAEFAAATLRGALGRWSARRPGPGPGEGPSASG